MLLDRWVGLNIPDFSGLPLHPFSSVPFTFMLPAIVQESLTASFNFYREGFLYQGMSCQKRLYKLIGIHTIENRLQAYSSGCKLANQGDRTIITVSAEHYKVWVDVGSEAIAQPLALLELQSPKLS
jgi:hypothetical protein